MLVLSRKISQQIRIGSDIRITVVKIDRNQVRLGISAPMGLTILREELVDGSSDRDEDPKLPLATAVPAAATADYTLCSLLQ